MKSLLFLPFLFFAISISQAQQYSIDAGLGLGTTFHDGSIGPGKVLFTSALNYQSNHRFDFSLDFLATGQMGFSDRTPILSIDNFDVYEAGLANLTNVMFFSRYKFAIKEPRKYAFVGAGAGLSHVTQRVNTNDTKRVAKSNFAVGLDLGIVRNHLTLGLRWISPVITPSFEENSEVTGRRVVYTEANLSPILFYAKYDILRVWRR